MEDSKQMELIRDPKILQDKCFYKRCAGQITALVPTMGYFHQGHLSLMKWARKNADIVIVSLFVNPTQFAPSEDLDSYPRDFERDKDLTEQEGVDILFIPDIESMYASNHDTWIQVKGLSNVLCGASRPSHFQGVCTIVCKLLMLTMPQKAIFGQKDWQQLAIIKRMLQDLNFPVEVVGLPIVRELDGLAMSSRNTYLDLQQRKEASQIYVGLLKAQQWVEQGNRDSFSILSKLEKFYRSNIPSGQIDYLELVDANELIPISHIDNEALLAVAIKVGRARLIDNIVLKG